MGNGKELIPNSYIESFQGAMDDDFNTPGALAVVFELAKELRRQSNLLTHEGKTDSPPEQIQQQWQTLVNLAQVLGLEAQPEAPTVTASKLTDEEIQILIQQRQAARKAKNFAESDRIRHKLQELGITLIDQSDGTTRWHS
jgi:cysteinyl-tRNA synthetase